jgi:hypothetical protein
MDGKFARLYHQLSFTFKEQTRGKKRRLSSKREISKGSFSVSAIAGANDHFHQDTPTAKRPKYTKKSSAADDRMRILPYDGPEPSLQKAGVRVLNVSDASVSPKKYLCEFLCKQNALLFLRYVASLVVPRVCCAKKKLLFSPCCFLLLFLRYIGVVVPRVYCAKKIQLLFLR